jgi:hypothetical protein
LRDAIASDIGAKQMRREWNASAALLVLVAIAMN